MNCASGYTSADSAMCRRAFGVLFPQRLFPCARACGAASSRMAPAASVMPSSLHAARAIRPSKLSARKLVSARKLGCASANVSAFGALAMLDRRPSGSTRKSAS